MSLTQMLEHLGTTINYTLQCKQEIYCYFFTFHSELTYPTNSFEISDESGTQQTIERFFFYEDNDYLVLETVAPCQSGAKYTFKAPSFHGELGDDLYGLYKSEYVNEEGENRWNTTY